MKILSLLSLAAGQQTRALQICLLLASIPRLSQAISFNPVPSANLDLSQLGRVGLAGEFNGISLYTFEGQGEGSFSTNGSQSVLARYPDGGFAPVASSDASIHAMCSFMLADGNMAGVIVAGNFTSLGGMESQGIAMINPNTSVVTPLPGLSGQVSALYCDQSTSTVYVGGSFKGANSTNAIAWVGTDGWTNLPFLGFNGPVSSITKSSTGKIIFGGTFSGLGNASVFNDPDLQIINLSGANLTAVSSISTAGFKDPKNIVCKASGVDGPGNTWLLADKTPGFWRADFGYGFRPTKLRLWNTRHEGRGTKTWRYTAMPINGIMNFTYVDSATGAIASCTSECPLSNDSDKPFQDFHFVNIIGMNAFRIDISEWYGNGGGLSGIELFQNDIYSYAIDEFNEPDCAVPISTGSRATVTGPWQVTSSHQSVSKYLTANFKNAADFLPSDAVVFFPHIKQSGNYSVNMYTPGCIQDETCSSRGRINVTGNMNPGSTSATFQSDLFQTNNFDKYDQIYFGYIEAGSDTFRPSVTISPSSGQAGNLTVVAQRVGFTLIDSDGGLNSIFEYDPTKASIDTSEFAKSTIDKAGKELGHGAGITVLATFGDITFAGGNYSTGNYDNIFAVNHTSAYSLPSGGLNGAVQAMYLNSTTLYVGGNFSSTSGTVTGGLNNIAAFDISKNEWKALGAGVNGRVMEIVPMSLNISSVTSETVISFTGTFDKINAFGNDAAISVSGFAIWVPSRANWLENTKITEMSFRGQLTAGVDLPNGGGSLYAGSLSSSQVGAYGAAGLSSSSLSRFPVQMQRIDPQTSGSVSRRATADNITVSGVVTGKFYEAGDLNITILAGHFGATASDGGSISNIVFIDSASNNSVTGIPQLSNSSTILTVDILDETLFAGGAITGTVNDATLNGLITYNLKTATLPTQPPALGGENVVVRDISVRPNTRDVYVAGTFERAGSLNCPGLCVFSGTAAQWNRPGSVLSGTVYATVWQTTNSLIVAGSLDIGGNKTTMATYDARTQVWTAFAPASELPGPVVAMTAANKEVSQFWVAGVATNGSTFLSKYDGSKWSLSSYSLGPSTTIRSLQILTLTEQHTATDLIPSNQALLVTGSINIPEFGNASAVLFNGTTFQPYILTSVTGDGGGYVSQFFSQRQQTFSDPKGHLALGFIVLIGLAIALALIFLMVLTGIIFERIRRKREGYTPAPTNMFDKTSQMSRLPPEQIFGTLGKGRSVGAPAI